MAQTNTEYFSGTIGTVSSGTTTLGYSGTYGGGLATPLNGNIDLIYSNGSNYNSISTAITNSNNMSKQVKVAVFTVKRNNKNEIISSEFIKEFWVEQKNGGSIVLAASKQLDNDFDPDTTVIREILTVSF
jgi:hypothetical protein